MKSCEPDNIKYIQCGSEAQDLGGDGNMGHQIKLW